MPEEKQTPALTADQEINLIAGRIIDEHRKHAFHSPIEWNLIAAKKIHTEWKAYFEAAQSQRVAELEKESKMYQQDYSDLQNKYLKLKEQLKSL